MKETHWFLGPEGFYVEVPGEELDRIFISFSGVSFWVMVSNDGPASGPGVSSHHSSS